ncbi:MULTISPECIES: DUF4244 domain-containing protein [Rhodococcus]|uniref:DUF4244 domain-containing protein n=1 Tax=Rhodococcus opacus TaxID=37919 RepID=A0AAX3YG58_RHOOP|nr:MULTISPECIES: DUF4244 domain-containing protein [Rhodococcus]MCZ4583820.1 DUF4244 domain-containing protein [Rhodococcus opacus]MDI9936139.1 DUF4244 domain-containing protein [Rhodococcus sp. IEGM 1351]UZG56383.1 DUF4244 domain-containing protein [Rhodococcus opacus]WLF48041.1 DUF4244 domain-containing protein [Rhodococcus opacus]
MGHGIRALAGVRALAEGRALTTRLILLATDEDGMSTAEYAIGTIAAAAFGAVLYSVVTGDSIVTALTNIIDKALNTAV